MADNTQIDNRPSSTKIDNNRAGFLDLPGELRNDIYKYALNLREDGSQQGGALSTAFMATCHEVHKEAVSFLYGSDEFMLSVSRTGQITFLNQHIAFDMIGEANFAGINQVRKLGVYVSSDNSTSVCKVQDALFVVFSFLRPGHQLHELAVNIDVEMPRDSDWGIFTSNYAERMIRTAIMQEFRHIKPGDISRPHLTAFLTDPFRLIRLADDGNKKGKFALSFTGQSGRPWRDLPVQLRTLMQSKTAALDYQTFVDHYAIVCKLCKVGQGLQLGFNRFDFRHMAAARITSDVQKFRKGHEAVVKDVRQSLKMRRYDSPAKIAEDVQKWEQCHREIEYLLVELEKALLAADTDTSHYGYPLIDNALKEWQTVGRREEQQKQAERKRKREAARATGGEDMSKKRKMIGSG